MILTTTNSLEGKKVDAYLGIVVGEAVMGVNLFRDMFASIRNIVGGRAGGYEKALEEGRQTALFEMQAKARDMGGDAVLGIHMDYETIDSGGGSMLLISVSGTAVRTRSG